MCIHEMLGISNLLNDTIINTRALIYLYKLWSGWLKRDSIVNNKIFV